MDVLTRTYTARQKQRDPAASGLDVLPNRNESSSKSSPVGSYGMQHYRKYYFAFSCLPWRKILSINLTLSTLSCNKIMSLL